jgi:O-antigen ligase
LLGSYSYLAGVGYVVISILLGFSSPILGTMMTVALVPFYGGEMSQGLGELVRAAPVLGSAARLLVDRVRLRGENSAPWAPDARLVGVAVLIMLLYPVTRIIGDGTEWAPSSRLLDDTLFLIGAPVAMYASWVAVSHLPRVAIDRLIGMIPFTLTCALVLAIGAWAGITLVDPFAFKGIVYGRLGALGYPTPTGMGIAIALPLAVGALWKRSHRTAILLGLLGIMTIILTESRGPLLALVGAAVIVSLLGRGIPRRYILGGAALLISAVLVVLLVRYPDLFQRLSHLRLPRLRGDEYRVLSWIAGIQIALAHPLTGGGWMSVRGWNDGELGGKGVNLSHNIVLQGLADGGFMLGGAVFAVIAGSMRSAWARRKAIPVYWIGAAVAVIVCGLWDMPQLRSFGAVMGGVALGLVARRAEHESEG